MAAVKMSAALIGITQLAEESGLPLVDKVYVDSSAAIGVAQRRGNGKLRHVIVGTVWIQERVETGELLMEKVAGAENPADALTKGVGPGTLVKFYKLCSHEGRQGRTKASLQLKA